MIIIKVNTPRGEYIIPAILVAEQRADYYAIKVDGYDKGSKEWYEEVEWVLRDNYELIDWLLNNSDWKDWEKYSLKISDKVKTTDDNFWRSSDQIDIINTIKYDYLDGKWIKNTGDYSRTNLNE